MLEEMINAMLSYFGLAKGYWDEAMLTACYILKRVPKEKNKITPYELWKKKKSLILTILRFGVVKQ